MREYFGRVSQRSSGANVIESSSFISVVVDAAEAK